LVQLKKGEEISYDESLEKWTSLKTTNGNSYIYSIKNVSWAGSGSITEIEVRNGVVVSKKFESHDPDNNIDESFIEVGSKIDSHKKTPARTIDQLYSECSVEYLSVNTGNIFTASTEGIMIACGYWPIGCVDDCFQGVTIDSLKWLSK
jgi:hypothetical protein